MLIPEVHDKHSAVKARQQMLSPSRKPRNKLSMINSIELKFCLKESLEISMMQNILAF